MNIDLRLMNINTLTSKQDEESIDFNNGVKQSAKIVFDEEVRKPKYRSMDKDERYIDGGDYKIEGNFDCCPREYVFYSGSMCVFLVK